LGIRCSIIPVPPLALSLPFLLPFYFPFLFPWKISKRKKGKGKKASGKGNRTAQAAKIKSGF